MIKNTKSAVYWSEQNALWESSGLAQQKFCEQQGLAYKRFVYWRGRLNTANVKAEPKLLKVSTKAARPPSEVISVAVSCLEVILHTGIKLRIKTEADISKASMLIQLLGGVQ